MHGWFVMQDGNFTSEDAVSVAFGPCTIFVEEEGFARMFKYIDVSVSDIREFSCPLDKSVE